MGPQDLAPVAGTTAVDPGPGAAVGADDDGVDDDVGGGNDAHSCCPGTEKHCKAASALSILYSPPPPGRGF